MSTKVVNTNLKMERYKRMLDRRKRCEENEAQSKTVTANNSSEKEDEDKRSKKSGKVSKSLSAAAEGINTTSQKPKCFVCFESPTAKNCNTSLEIPHSVMKYVTNSEVLTSDIISSLRCPSDSYIHCKKCTDLSDSVNRLSVQLSEIQSQLTTAVESYIGRIAKCRKKYRTKSFNTITVAKNIFSENTDDGYNDNDNNSTTSPKTVPNTCKTKLGHFDFNTGLFIDASQEPDISMSTRNKKEATSSKSSIKSSSKNSSLKRSAIEKKKPLIPKSTKIKAKGDKFPEGNLNKLKVYRFKCKQCPKVFWSNVGLLSHVQSHSKDEHTVDKPAIVDACTDESMDDDTGGKNDEANTSKLPSVISSLVSSTRLLKPEVKCIQCKTTLQSGNSVPAHLMKVHMEGRETFYCLHCKKAYIFPINSLSTNSSNTKITYKRLFRKPKLN